jgi:hydrogenase maturation protease
MNGKNRTLIAGVGSDFGDDRLGFIVVERLAGSLPECVLKTFRSPLDLLDHLSDVAVLHLIDACRDGDAPGTILRLDWPGAKFKSVRFCGTHDFDLISTLRLAESLRLLPSRVTIWSIASAESDTDVQPTAALSPVVAAATELLVDMLKSEARARRTAIESVIPHA